MEVDICAVTLMPIKTKQKKKRKRKEKRGSQIQHKWIQSNSEAGTVVAVVIIKKSTT